jgi:hypothetical protein
MSEQLPPITVVKYSHTQNFSGNMLDKVIHDFPECTRVKQSGWKTGDPAHSTFDLSWGPTDGFEKYTEDAFMSTVLVLAGRTRVDDFEISSMIHLSDVIVEPKSTDFQRFIPSLLYGFHELTREDSRVALLAGGNYYSETYELERYFRKNYREMLKLIKTTTFDSLGIDISVDPPKTRRGLTHVYYDTPQRIAHILETYI